MGQFKKYLLNEESGLGDIGPKLHQLFHSDYLNNQVGGAFVSNTPMHDLKLPNTGISVPSVERTGRITTLLLKRNPIFIKLSDGTEAHFTYDEFRRIDGKPDLGKVMTIIFQRHPDDTSDGVSKIDKAIVRE